MTDLHSRLLAELMKPDRYLMRGHDVCGFRVIDNASPRVVDNFVGEDKYDEASSFCSRLNASHRLVSILRMIAEDLPEEAIGKAYSGFYANGVKTCSTRKAIKAAIAIALLSILPEEK